MINNKEVLFKKILLIGVLIGLIVGLLVFIITKNILFTIIGVILPSILAFLFFILTNKNSSSFNKVTYKSQPPIRKYDPSPRYDTNTISASPIKKEIPTLKQMDEDEIAEKKLKTKLFQKKIIFSLIAGMVFALIAFFMKKQILLSIVVFIAVPVLFFLFDYFKKMLDKSGRIKRIELVFPDFLQLMASNLRAGMTIDRSMFLSAREEFSPLDEEIHKTGKDITTGKTLEVSLLDMSKRIDSPKISKVIMLIISGIKAGGNLATLLEETSVNMREKDFVEKRASSNVMMYVIFIFLTVAMGAPALFSLSSVLVEILTKLLAGIPALDTSSTMSMPFTLSSISISVDFVRYYCITFIVVTDILASLTLGLVSKGEEKEGLKYMLPLLAISLGIFFIARFVMANFMSSLFG